VILQAKTTAYPLSFISEPGRFGFAVSLEFEKRVPVHD